MLPSLEVRPSHHPFPNLGAIHRSHLHLSSPNLKSATARRVDYRAREVSSGSSHSPDQPRAGFADMSSWQRSQTSDHHSTQQSSSSRPTTSSSNRQGHDNRPPSRASPRITAHDRPSRESPEQSRGWSSQQGHPERDDMQVDEASEHRQGSSSTGTSSAGKRRDSDASLTASQSSAQGLRHDFRERLEIGRPRAASNDMARVTLPPISALTSSLGLSDRSARDGSRSAGPSSRGLPDSLAPGPSMRSTHDDLEDDFRVARRSPHSYPSSFAWGNQRATMSSDNLPEYSRRPLHVRGKAAEEEAFDSRSIGPDRRVRTPASTSPYARPSTMEESLGPPRPKDRELRPFDAHGRRGGPNLPHAIAMDASTADIDRLFDNLMLIQDVNRRNGLFTGVRLSLSVMNDRHAPQVIIERIYNELDTLKTYSPTQAELIAADLGLQVSDEASQELTASASRSRPGALTAPASTEFFRPPHHDAATSPQSERSAWINTPAVASGHDDRADPFLAKPMRSRSYTSHFRPHSPSRDAVPHMEGGRLSALGHRSGLEDYAVQQEGFTGGHYARPRGEPSVLATQRMAAYSSGSPTYISGVPPPHLPYARIDERHQQQLELLDRRRLAGKGMKRVRKRKNEHHQECLGCQAKETPEWRKGPMGPRTLCNACGLLYAKLTRRKQQEAEAAAKASGKSPEDVAREMEESASDKQASLEALRAELNLANGLRNRSGSSSSSFAPYPPFRGAPPARTFSLREQLPPQRGRAHTMSQLGPDSTLHDAERSHAFSYDDRTSNPRFRPNVYEQRRY